MNINGTNSCPAKVIHFSGTALDKKGLDSKLLPKEMVYGESSSWRTANILKFPRQSGIMTQNNDSVFSPTRSNHHHRIQNALNMAEENGYASTLILFRLSGYPILEESYGSEPAAKLSLRIGELLRKCLRNDTLVEQIAPDEFVVVPTKIENTDLAIEIAQRAADHCNNCYLLDGFNFSLHCVAGIAHYPNHSRESSELIRFARIALRQSPNLKDSFCYLYSQEMLKEQQSRVSMEVELDQAIAKDRLLLNYQPQYLLGTKQIIGVEALIRLRSDSGEILSPAKFIPIAEKSGMIIQLGDWVIREACQQMRRWRDAGCGEIRVSVNVSPRQLTDDHLVEVVSQAVRSSGLNFSDLEIEITEQCDFENLPMAEKVLLELANKGVRLAVDDFGSGYSSLAYITRLPFTVLKIDRSLVENIPDDPRAKQVVQGLVAMAASLQLEVIAEGIETKAQNEFLNEIGCYMGQGFVFARPCSPEDCQQLLLEQ